jgi:predicted ATPase/serine/threonine protein kinase
VRSRRRVLAAVTLTPGARIAGYEVEDELGRGGMGVVYRATQLALERTVALKVVAPELAADSRFRERFAREAKLAAALDHPNVLPVYEAGHSDGVLFIATRYVAGRDLAAILREERRLEPARAAAIVGQVGAALDAAHAIGLVHRDVKPANFLVENQGGRETAYLTDFGLARLRAGQSGITARGGFLGTVGYAPPEQIRGDAVDGRSDVYALGCLLYEALTGEVPYAYDDEIARLWAHLNEAPPVPSARKPELSAFDPIMRRALAKDQDQRYEAAGALADAAMAIAATPGETVATPNDRVGTPNLPTPPTALVGREQELQDLLELLGGDLVRLVTVIGAGGSGKSRLALEAARHLSGHFPEGVYWVDLQAIRDGELVIPAITAALGVGDQPLREIATKSSLLVLDNFEQVVDAAPRLADLLAAGPGVKILATSRESLRVEAEHQYPLPPLGDMDALDLFTRRARAVEPSFSTTPSVAVLCRRLDNLPLALELAAARVRVASPETLLARFEQRLRLLTGGKRDLPPRQQTLRATIEWSYDLLDLEERRLFARFSVFASGCVLDATEQVCDANLDTLQSLLDKSLLRHESGRYTMLETIQEYAADLLDQSGEADEIRGRHADHFLRLVELEEPRLRGVDERAAVDRVAQELPNLRRGLERALAIGDVETAGRLSGGLHAFWYHSGSFTEGRGWAEQALSLGGRLAVREKVLATAGELALLQGDVDVARRHLTERLELCIELGDADRLASAYTLLGHVASAARDWTYARDLYEQSLQLDEQTREQRVVWQSRAVSLNNVGWALLNLGQFDDSQSRRLSHPLVRRAATSSAWRS